MRDGIIPEKYKAYIRDCNDISAAWERLEEQVPKVVVQNEIIRHFRDLKSLTRQTARSPMCLRELASNMSLFFNRLTDLGLEDEVKSVGFLADAHSKIDDDTAIQYQTQLRLAKKCGASTVDSIEEIAIFLRETATTLEMKLSANLSNDENSKIIKSSINVKIIGTNIFTERL